MTKMRYAKQTISKSHTKHVYQAMFHDHVGQLRGNLYYLLTKAMIREVNKTLGGTFQTVTVEDSDWGDPFSNTKTIRSTMFTQAHMADKHMGIKMASLTRANNRAGRLHSIKLVFDV